MTSRSQNEKLAEKIESTVAWTQFEPMVNEAEWKLIIAALRADAAPLDRDAVIEVARQLGHIAFNIDSGLLMTRTEARICAHAAQLLKRSGGGDSEALRASVLLCARMYNAKRYKQRMLLYTVMHI